MIKEVLKEIPVILAATTLLLNGCSTAASHEPAGDEVPPEDRTSPSTEVTLAGYYFPLSLRWLTDGEKEKAIEIALETLEAQEWVQKEYYYITSFNWMVMYPDPSGDGYSAYQSFDYEIVETGIPIYESPDRVITQANDKDAEIYPNVSITFGEPPESRFGVVVDLERERVVQIIPYPIKHPAGSPSTPTGLPQEE